MSASGSHSVGLEMPMAKCLGIISPDHADVSIDYEMLRLDRWLSSHQINNVDVRIEFAGTSGGGHVADALLRVGSVESLRRPALRLAREGCDVVVFECTSGSFIGGFEWCKKQAAAITDITGVAYTNATMAIICGVHAIGESRVDLLSPYPAEITDVLIDCLGDAKIEVDVVKSLNAVDGEASFHIDILKEMESYASRNRRRGVPILLPDTAVNTLEVISALEDIAQRPVITANQACVWHGLSLMDCFEPIEDAGYLMLIDPSEKTCCDV